jgi:hypothetical protein
METELYKNQLFKHKEYLKKKRISCFFIIIPYNSMEETTNLDYSRVEIAVAERSARPKGKKCR